MNKIATLWACRFEKLTGWVCQVCQTFTKANTPQQYRYWNEEIADEKQMGTRPHC